MFKLLYSCTHFTKSFNLGFSSTWTDNFQDVQAGFQRGKGNRDQIADICWILEKARELKKNICFFDYTKTFDSVDYNKLEYSQRDRNTRPPYLSPEKPLCRSKSNS